MLWNYLFFILCGFFAGSIMFSYIIPKLFCGVDIIEASADHNPGTANAVKHAGFFVGMICLVLELAKGFVPVYIASHMLDERPLLFSLILVAPVLGHALSPMLRFRGGKSIAVSFGALLGLVNHWSLLICLAGSFIFLSVVLVVRPHSLRVIAAFLCLAGFCAFCFPIPSLRLGGLLIAATVIVKHLFCYDRVRPEIGFFLWTRPRPAPRSEELKDKV